MGVLALLIVLFSPYIRLLCHDGSCDRTFMVVT
jgi:hypothetical protein